MTETDQEREEKVLRRMLKTPPKPHKEKKAGDQNGARQRVNPKGR